MKKAKYLMMLLAMLACAYTLSACSSDDADNENLSSYIIGTWHSYKLVGYYQQKDITLDVTKTGAYSAAYIELQFEKNGKVCMSSWQQDNYGLSSWVSEYGTYIVKDYSVVIAGEGSESVSLMFDEKTKELYVREVGSYGTYENITAYLYLKK